MTTLTTSIKALLPAVFLTAALTGVAQGYYDDDIYYNPKEEKVVKQQKKQQKPVSYYHLDSKRGGGDYQPADTYAPTDNPLNVDIDEYNRRGQFLVSDSVVADSSLVNEFEYTRRIEQFHNPDIINGSDDSDLQEYYYTARQQPVDINVYVIDNPWSWRYSNPWYWNAWGPAWSWGPSWGYPGWGGCWHPSHGPVWGGGHAWRPSSPGASRPHRPSNGSMATHRPGSYAPGSAGSISRPGNMGIGRRPGAASSGYRPGNSSRPGSYAPSNGGSNHGGASNGSINLNRGRNNSGSYNQGSNRQNSRSSYNQQSRGGSSWRQSGGGGGSRGMSGSHGGGGSSHGGGGGRGRR